MIVEDFEVEFVFQFPLQNNYSRPYALAWKNSVCKKATCKMIRGQVSAVSVHITDLNPP